MPDRDNRDGKFVVPGERLGVIEEFIPGPGTYVDEGGIYALTTGQIAVNKPKREVSILPLVHAPLIMKKGDTVIGKMASVQERSGTVRILQINEKPVSDFTGIMHVSDVSKNYVKSMSDAFKVGDIVRARVISTANRESHLSTQDDNLGVMQAFCSNCGYQLTLGNGQLRCPNCKRSEQRKIVPDYARA